MPVFRELFSRSLGPFGVLVGQRVPALAIERGDLLEGFIVHRPARFKAVLVPGGVRDLFPIERVDLINRLEPVEQTLAAKAIDPGLDGFRERTVVRGDEGRPTEQPLDARPTKGLNEVRRH